ncbi:MAG: potassium channel family protein [Candidatus Nanopelagicales bacterium]
MAARMAALADRDAANKYGLVLILLAVSYVASVVADSPAGITTVMLVQLLTLWLAFSASESHRAQRIAGIACLLAGLAAVAAAIFGHALHLDAGALRAISLFSVLAYLIAPLVILRHLIRRSVVDARTILGAIAIYLMLGMMFAFTFRAIGLFQSDPFFESGGPGDNADFLFFSFITLTTTGYGNLVPAGNPGQTTAVLEAIVGQLFLVTALAKIVSAWRLPRAAAHPADPAE